MVRLIVESSSDYTREEALARGLIFIPMTVTIDDVSYRAGENLTAKHFYELLIETDGLPATSQVPPFVFEEVFDSVIDAGDTAIVITISASLSGTYQSACAAADHSRFRDRIFVVDSRTASIGERILIEYARSLAERGLSAAEIFRQLESEKDRVTVVALLDTLEYLKRGGRISPAVSFVGGMLSIKPVISIEGGEIKLIGKARGSKNGNNFLTTAVKTRGIDFSLPHTLAYTGLDASVLMKYKEDCRELWEKKVHDLPVTEIGPAIGTHIGPGAIGTAFFRPAADEAE